MKLKFLFDDEEKKEDIFKPQLGLDIKEEGFAEKPEENILSNLLNTMKDYKKQIDELEKLAKERSFVEVELRTYRYAIGQYNKAVDKYNEILKKEEIKIGLPKTKITPTQIGWTQRMRGIGEAPEKYTLEGVTSDYMQANKSAWATWFKELQTTPDKWKFLKGETWSPELKAISEEAKSLSKKASELGVNPDDWIQYGLYAAFFTTLAISIYPVVAGLPKTLLNELMFKVEGKTVKGKELLRALGRVRYSSTPAAFGKPSTFDKKIFVKFVKEGALKSVSERMAKGIRITEVVPRFAFADKLYGGLPVDAMIKTLVETGKISAEISKDLRLSAPEKISQVIQSLSIASPVIASKLSEELSKYLPKEEIPKVEVKEPVIPKLTKAERTILESPIEIEEGKVTFSWAELSPKAREKAIEKLEERGYVKGVLLTEKGIELANVLKTRIEAEKKGIHVAEKEIKRPMTDEQLLKVAPREELITGKIGGKDFYSDTKIMLKGKPEIKDAFISKHKPDFEKLIADLPKEEIKINPITFSYKKDQTRLVWFDNKVPIQEKYYDYILKKFPEAEFRSVEKIDPKEPTPKQPIKIYEKDEFIGAVMPLTIDKVDIPENVMKVEVKPPEIKHVELKPGEKITREYLDRVMGLEKPEEIPKVEPKPPIVPIKKPEVVKPKIKLELEKPPKEIPKLLALEAKYPAKIIKEEIEELKPLSTPAQIKKAHAIANAKAMISDKGKMKPQYRKLAEAMTGKKSIKKMTEEEAELFIDSLNRLPEPKMRDGKLIPPTIARTMKLVPWGFFQKEYKEPTPIWLLKDQTYYAEQLGIKSLVAPFEIGKQKFDLEFRESSKMVDKIANKLNKIAETPAKERLKAILKNIPTKAESKMAELINKYEEIPPGLSQAEEDVFKWFRNLGRNIWRRENEIREKLDLPLIKYRKAYFRHTADIMAKEMLEGKYPFPQGLKYWAQRMVGKKIFNPMEFQRKLSDDLIDLWSKNLRAVTKSMLWSGLKEIYLAQPAKFFSEQLSAISKDLPIYKHLNPEEKRVYDTTKVIPASTKKWAIDYINQVIKGQETETDAGLNRIVTQSGLKGLFDKVLSPFGRTVGRKPITNTFQTLGRVTISGVMGWVPRQIIRNAFQQTQNLALYGVKATLKAFLPASIDKNLKELLSESLFLKSYTGFEELPINLMGKLEKVWLGPYGKVACYNAAQGMKAAYWSTSDLIKNPKYKKFGWADPQRTEDTPKDKLFPSEKEKLLKEMEFGSSATQYQYIPMGMPGVFRYKALIPLTRLQSWWMNYFTKFLREATYRVLKGETGYGQKLPWSYRINFAKYLIIGGAILTALGYRRSFLLGVAPTWLSPAAQVALGFYNYATAKYDWQRNKALKQIHNSWKAFVPGSLAWKDFMAAWNGEKDLKDLFFYKKVVEKKKISPPLKIAIPKSEKLKFIEPELKIKSKKLKFTF